MLTGLFWGLDPEPMQLKRFAQGDWLGIATMAVGLGALQVVLEEGNKDDWFGSPFILRLSILSAVSMAVFLYWELRAGNRYPLVNLRLFARWNFTFATISNVMLGFVLYSAVYLIPVYLAVAHGYSARQSGEVLAWIGLPQLVIIPFMPMLMKRFDVRWLLTAGFGLFAVSCFMNMHLGPDDSGPQLLIPNLIRAAGQAMVFTPISLIATAGISFKDAGSASSLFNMLRNLGGAIGIATVQTFETNREKFHSAIMTPQVSLLDPATQQRLAAMQQYFMAHGMADPAAARAESVILLGRAVRGQATYLAYGDAFALLGVAMVVATAATFFLRKPQGGAAPGAH
jgi:DHA2 family multidrug resistance protein